MVVFVRGDGWRVFVALVALVGGSIDWRSCEDPKVPGNQSRSLNTLSHMNMLFLKARLQARPSSGMPPSIFINRTCLSLLE